MFMRVSVGIHGTDIDRVIETYHLMSNKFIMHASPTLFHAGLKNAQMSSCYLLPLGSHDIYDTFKTLSDCAIISRHAGGIGLNINGLSATGYGSANASV